MSLWRLLPVSGVMVVLGRAIGFYVFDALLFGASLTLLVMLCSRGIYVEDSIYLEDTSRDMKSRIFGKFDKIYTHHFS